MLPGVGAHALMIKYLDGDATFTAPRHRHDFEQISFAIDGEPDFGDGLVCTAGQAAYFPAGAPYGPETIASAEMLLLQWSSTWVTPRQNREAMLELSTRRPLSRRVVHLRGRAVPKTPSTARKRCGSTCTNGHSSIRSPAIPSRS